MTIAPTPNKKLKASGSKEGERDRKRPRHIPSTSHDPSIRTKNARNQIGPQSKVSTSMSFGAIKNRFRKSKKFAEIRRQEATRSLVNVTQAFHFLHVSHHECRLFLATRKQVELHLNPSNPATIQRYRALLILSTPFSGRVRSSGRIQRRARKKLPQSSVRRTWLRNHRRTSRRSLYVPICRRSGSFVSFRSFYNS